MKITKGKMMLVDEETGEIIMNEINFRNLSLNQKKGISKQQVDKMLHEANGDISKVDIAMLFSYCKMIKVIDNFNQIGMEGVWRDRDVEKCLTENIDLIGYVFKMFCSSNKYSNFIKINHVVFVEKWTQLFELVGISLNSKRTQQKFKKYLVENDLVRVYTHIGRDGKKKNKFIINPFKYRNSYFVSELAISQFQDYIETGVNISDYAVKYLEVKETIDSEWEYRNSDELDDKEKS